jgi:hypothetical protein
LFNALTKPSEDKSGAKVKPKLTKKEFIELVKADPTTRLNNIDIEFTEYDTTIESAMGSLADGDLELSEQLITSRAKHDWGYVAPFLDELTVLLDEYTNIRRAYDNYEDYLFEGTNIMPIKCSLQQSRPTCVFWSILRALHPEKNLKETSNI